MENKTIVSTEIQVRLIKVQETGFFIDSNLPNSQTDLDFEKMQVQFEVGFNIDVKTDLLILNVAVRYLYPFGNELRRITELSSSNHFKVHGLANMIDINEQEQVTDKAGFLPTLLGIAIGTLRGMLVVKTVGTKLADYPLLIVNPTELLKPLSTENESLNG